VQAIRALRRECHEFYHIFKLLNSKSKKAFKQIKMYFGVCSRKLQRYTLTGVNRWCYKSSSEQHHLKGLFSAYDGVRLFNRASMAGPETELLNFYVTLKGKARVFPLEVTAGFQQLRRATLGCCRSCSSGFCIRDNKCGVLAIAACFTHLTMICAKTGPIFVFTVKKHYCSKCCLY